MGTLLTTGEVAKLCGVTPDAVLKWVKKGKLPAIRTVGGHYRVPREACTALGLDTVNREAPEPTTAPRPTSQPTPQRCWEYFANQNSPPEACLDCLVYQARAQYCYKLAALGVEAGHFCVTDCQDCSFYRACHGMATTVLVVTRDDALGRQLEEQNDPEKVCLYFARSGYESSTLIGKYRPAVVVLDSELTEVREGTLPASAMQDDRIPNARVFVARRAGDEEAVDRLDIPTLRAPFTAKRIEQLAEEATRGRRAPCDAA